MSNGLLNCFWVVYDPLSFICLVKPWAIEIMVCVWIDVVNDLMFCFPRPDHHWLIGRTERGFDFLGYHFHSQGLTVAKKTLMRFVERATRLNEQESGEPLSSARLGSYVKRWYLWVRAGLPKPLRSYVMQNSALGRYRWFEVWHFTI